MDVIPSLFDQLWLVPTVEVVIRSLRWFWQWLIAHYSFG